MQVDDLGYQRRGGGATGAKKRASMAPGAPKGGEGGGQ
jgi:hypothetical protein